MHPVTPHDVTEPADTLHGASPSTARAGVSRASSREPASMRPSSMRACSSAMRSGSITPRSRRSPRRVLAPEARQTPSPRSRRAGSRASRSRAFSAARNSGDCRFKLNRRHAGAAAGDRDRGRGGAGCARPASIAARARCASSISAPARARCCWRCCSELPNAFGRRHGYQRRRARLRARQCRRARPCCPRVVRGVRLWRSASAGRSISSSPIRPMSRAARSPACRPRCATSIRAARSTAAPDGLDGYRAIAARCPPPARAEWRAGAGTRAGTSSAP